MTYPHPESVANKNQPGGYAGLDQTGHLTASVLGLNEVAISTTTTLTAANLGKMHACTLTSSGYTVTLPTPAGVAGYTISVRVVSASTKLLTLATAAGTIDGASTRIMWAGESAILESDGTNWVKVGGRTLPMVAAIAANASTAVASGAVTFITLDTSKRDNTGLMVTTSGTGGLAIQRGGTYSIRGRIGMFGAPANASRVLIQVYQSATAVVQGEISALSGAFTTFPITDEVALTAGQTLTLAMYQNSGSSWSSVTGAGQNASALSAVEIPAW